MAATTSKSAIPVAPIATYLLIALNIAVFMLVGGGQSAYNLGATNQRFVFEFGEYYRLVTAMFLHADLIHLAANMYALFGIGRVLEAYYGHARFLVIYFLGGLAGAFASAILNTPDISSVGASGAVFAIFGAEMFFFWRHKDALGEVADKGLSRSLQAIALNIFNGFRPDTNIDNWAHIGGCVGGIVTAGILGTQFTMRRQPESPYSAFVEDTRPRGFRVFAAASLVGVVLLGSTGFSAGTPRTMTVSNVSLTVPGGYRILTDLENEEFCQTFGVHCLIVGGVSDVVFEVDRFSNPALLLVSLEQFDETAADLIEDEGGTLATRDEIQMAGRRAIQRVYEVGEQTRMFVFAKSPSGGFLRFYAEASHSSFADYRAELETILASIQFVESPPAE